MAVYFATKAFVLWFSEGLHEEVKKQATAQAHRFFPRGTVRPAVGILKK